MNSTKPITIILRKAILLAFLTFAMLLICACRRNSNTSRKITFSQVQSSLLEYDSDALIISNHSGRMRPYLVSRGGWKALLNTSAEQGLSRVDLYKPMLARFGNVLFAGQIEGRPNFDIYLFDRKSNTVKNKTNTPGVDEGQMCVSPNGKLLSFRSDGHQKIKKIGNWEKRLLAQHVPPFFDCIWQDDSTLIGVELVGRENQSWKYKLHVCALESGMRCRQTAALNQTVHFLKFTRYKERVSAILSQSNVNFRRLYTFDNNFGALSVALQHDGADIVDLTPVGVRIGAKSRYYLLSHDLQRMLSSKEDIVYYSDTINGEVFGIVASRARAKSPAVLKDGKWNFIKVSDVEPPLDAPQIEEITLPSPGGKQDYQAFMFGPKQNKKMVIWLHGGPKENVSPRYNAYFHSLVVQGFTVLALNYPGSTGRGWTFEQRFTKEQLLDSFRALEQYLQAAKVETVVVWSVSSGFQGLRLWLQNGLRLSAAVEQAAQATLPQRTRARYQAESRGVRYFAIRGEFDRNPGGRIEFEYEGGHDITDPKHFAGLFEEIAPFLAGL